MKGRIGTVLIGLQLVVTGIFASVAHASIVDAVKLNGTAWFVENTNDSLMGFSLTDGSLTTTVPLSGAPLAVDSYGSSLVLLVGDSVYSYDPSTGTVGMQHNIPGTPSDIAVVGDSIYVSYQGPTSPALLKISAINGDWQGDHLLDSPMPKIVGRQMGGGDDRLYSYKGTGLQYVDLPSTIGATDDVTVNFEDVDPSVSMYYQNAANLFLDDADGFVALDNGATWDLQSSLSSPPSQVVDQHLDGRAFSWMAADASWQPVVVRPAWSVCAGSAVTDVAFYSGGVFQGLLPETSSVTQIFTGATAGTYFLFAPSTTAGDPPVQLVDTLTNPSPQAFDGTSQEPAVDPTTIDFSSISLDKNNLALGDDGDTVYVLYPGTGQCDSDVLRYSLSANAWLSSIPLRWKADNMRLVHNDPTSATDDVLVVSYPSAETAYGNRFLMISEIPLTGATPTENTAADLDHNTSANLGENDVPLKNLIPLSHSFAFVTGDTSGNPDNLWTAPLAADTSDKAPLGGTQAVSLFWNPATSRIFTTDGQSMDAFEVAGETTTPTLTDDGSAPLAQDATLPISVSPDGKIILDGAGHMYAYDLGTGFADRATDALGVVPDLLTWAQNTVGGEYPVYSAEYDSANGVTNLERWVPQLGTDGHYAISGDFSETLVGQPLGLFIKDPAQDSLVAVTKDGGVLRFATYDNQLVEQTNTTAGGGSASSGGSSSGSSGGSGPTVVSYINGTGSGGGGGGALGLPLFGVLGLLGLMRRRRFA